MAVRTSPAAFLSCSILAEPAIELPVVPAVHVAVPVEVEIPEVAGVPGGRPECGSEEGAIRLIHVVIAISDEVRATAGLSADALPQREVAIRGRNEPMIVRTVVETRGLAKLIHDEHVEAA